jgi:hypothetical protein
VSQEFLLQIFSSQGAPPILMTPVDIFFATSSAGVVDTGGKFAISVNDIVGKFANGVNNAGGKLPPV